MSMLNIQQQPSVNPTRGRVLGDLEVCRITLDKRGQVCKTKVQKPLDNFHQQNQHKPNVMLKLT